VFQLKSQLLISTITSTFQLLRTAGLGDLPVLAQSTVQGDYTFLIVRYLVHSEPVSVALGEWARFDTIPKMMPSVTPM